MFLESGPLSKRFRYPPLHGCSLVSVLSVGWLGEVDAIPRAAPRRFLSKHFDLSALRVIFQHLEKKSRSRGRFEDSPSRLSSRLCIYETDDSPLSVSLALRIVDWTILREIVPCVWDWDLSDDNWTILMIRWRMFVYLCVAGIFLSLDPDNYENIELDGF